MPKDHEYTYKLLKWYADSAKTFTQTATAALVLPILFFKQVLGGALAGEKGLSLIFASWGCFLVTIGCGLAFHWLAPKFYQIEVEALKANRLQNNPGYVFGLMLLAFFAGALLFTIDAGIRLTNH